MIQHDTIYYKAYDSQAGEPMLQPSVPSFEALGEALVRTDSVMYRYVPSDSLATAEAIAVYGSLTETVAPRYHDRTPANTPFTSSVAFQGCVIALLIIYVLLIYRFRSDIVALLGNRKTLIDEIENPSHSSIFGRFFTTTVGVGVLLGAVMVVKGADLAPAVMGSLVAPQWIYALAVPAVMVVAVAVMLVQVAMLWLIGRVAMCEDITSQLLRLRKISFSILTISCAPTVLLYALCEIGSSRLLLYLIVIEIVAIFLVFLYETFALFISKKISVLHWILYLCTVELFPVSLIVLTALREF